MNKPILPASWSRRLPWFFLLLAIVLATGSIILLVLNLHTPVPASWANAGGPRDNPSDILSTLLLSTTFIPSGLFGLLVLLRRPHHLVGWLLCALGVLGGLTAFLGEFVVYGYYTASTPLPGVEVAAWVTNWVWIGLFTTMLWMLAVFPDGMPLNRRWHLLTATPVFLFTALTFAAAAIETPMTSAFQTPNPFVNHHRESLYNALFMAGMTSVSVAVLPVLAQILVRFRQSRGRERQQMKWLFSGVALMAIMILVGLPLSSQVLGNLVGDILVSLSILGPLLGIGIAMLRHRLYDIDLIIRRTLIYSVLTALLALVYFGSVVVLQGLVTAVSGEPSSLTIVLSTLAIAVLFSPLRRRVQELIDRRFFRRKYDAAQMLNQFAETARAEAELDKLGQELLAVVGKTMQPETAWLWLRGENGSESVVMREGVEV